MISNSIVEWLEDLPGVGMGEHGRAEVRDVKEVERPAPRTQPLAALVDDGKLGDARDCRHTHAVVKVATLFGTYKIMSELPGAHMDYARFRFV